MKPVIDHIWSDPSIRRIMIDHIHVGEKRELEQEILPIMNTTITLILDKLY